MLSVVPAQCLGYAAKKLLAYSTGFSCYSTLRRWVYAKCRPGLRMTLVTCQYYILNQYHWFFIHVVIG